jgi:hypothetical protein
MSDDERVRAAIDTGHCPDCDHRGFVLGPRGGASINIECGNVKCLARFNVCTAATPQRISVVMAQRLPRRRDGGASNWGYDHA